MVSIRHGAKGALVAGLAALAHGPVVVAAAPAAEVATLEEVTVTAEKREESLQKTPISIVAFTGADLEQKGISSVADLQSLVPNVQMTAHPNAAATTLITIRGVGLNDDQITQDPNTAVYVDGVYVARSQGLAADLAELERIEVLRGPQGTLYGRNAQGGAINYITRRPVPDKIEFRGQLTGGSRDLIKGRASVNVPLGDNAAARLSYQQEKQDGFVRNLGNTVPWFGSRDRHALRADFAWGPTDRFDVRYAFDRSDIDDSPAFLARVPLYPATASRPSAGSSTVNNLVPNDINTQGHSLTLTFDLGDNLTLKSISAYRELSNFQNENYLAGVLGSLPLFRNASQTDQRQRSQELQLIGGTADGVLRYIAGLYYFAESGDLGSATVTLQAPTTESRQQATIDNTAYAVFGQATWSPAALDQRLHLTVGGRWSRDEREATLDRDTRNINTGVVIPDPSHGAGKRSFSNFSPSFVAAYDVTERVNVFGKVVRGYKTGGYNTRASSIARFNAGFNEETLTSFELGFKSELAGNRLRLNGTAFRSRYDDIQVNVQSDPTNIRIVDVLNAGKATIDGVELELLARPLPPLTVSLSYGYLDARYDEVRDATGTDLSSRYNFLSPKHSVNADVGYVAPRLPFGVLSMSAGYSWRDKRYASTSQPELVVGGYSLVNARIVLAEIPRLGKLRLALWGKNLTDEEYYVHHSTLGTGVYAAIFGEPRTYGLDAFLEF